MVTYKCVVHFDVKGFYFRFFFFFLNKKLPGKNDAFYCSDAFFSFHLYFIFVFQLLSDVDVYSLINLFWKTLPMSDSLVRINRLI